MRLIFPCALIAALVSFSSHALELKGRLVQGGMAVGHVEPGTGILLNDEPVAVSADGWFVIGFGRDAERDQRLVAIAPDGSRSGRALVIEDRDFPVERVDGLPPRTVTIPPEEQARRAHEAAMVGDARAPLSDFLHWRGGFRLPAEGRISGVYGSQRILNGEPRSPHYGLDIAAPVGTPIYAPAVGIIRLAEPDFLLEGGIVIIDHGLGVSSTLFHMNSVDVSVGDVVGQGTVIGTIGATGRASGPHVDWRVNWRNVRLDPALLIEDGAGR